MLAAPQARPQDPPARSEYGAPLCARASGPQQSLGRGTPSRRRHGGLPLRRKLPAPSYVCGASVTFLTSRARGVHTSVRRGRGRAHEGSRRPFDAEHSDRQRYSPLTAGLGGRSCSSAAGKSGSSIFAPGGPALLCQPRGCLCDCWQPRRTPEGHPGNKEEGRQVVRGRARDERRCEPLARATSKT